jgi:hypothetical protein
MKSWLAAGLKKYDSDMKWYFYELVEVVTKAKASRHTEKFYYNYLTLCIYQLEEEGGVGMMCYCVSVRQ